jgi:hypothetical protein
MSRWDKIACRRTVSVCTVLSLQSGGRFAYLALKLVLMGSVLMFRWDKRSEWTLVPSGQNRRAERPLVFWGHKPINAP